MIEESPVLCNSLRRDANRRGILWAGPGVIDTLETGVACDHGSQSFEASPLLLKAGDQGGVAFVRATDGLNGIRVEQSRGHIGKEPEGEPDEHAENQFHSWALTLATRSKRQMGCFSKTTRVALFRFTSMKMVLSKSFSASSVTAESESP